MHTNCKICGHIAALPRFLVWHLRTAHSLTKQEYYDAYLKKHDDGKCRYCKKQTTFRNWSYQKFCSERCSGLYKKENGTATKYWLGKKQSEAVISKRIQNTNQTLKECARTATLVSRYGSANTLLSMTKAAYTARGNKISKALKARLSRKDFNSDHWFKNLQKFNSGYKTGRYNGLFYRSSYERKFLQLCKLNSIKVESAETQEFKVPYTDADGNKRWYFPDFYLPKFKLVVEIKPYALGQSDTNKRKFLSVKKRKKYKLLVITERCGLLHKHSWPQLLKWIRRFAKSDEYFCVASQS